MKGVGGGFAYEKAVSFEKLVGFVSGKPETNVFIDGLD
jgi:hypothetical protein